MIKYQRTDPLELKILFDTLLHKIGDIHQTEHLLMDKLAECLWQSQSKQEAPNEQFYLEACRSLI